MIVAFVQCYWTVFLILKVRCWEIQDNGQTVPKAQQMHTGPVLDVCWSDVGLFINFTFVLNCWTEFQLVPSSN